MVYNEGFGGSASSVLWMVSSAMAGETRTSSSGSEVVLLATAAADGDSMVLPPKVCTSILISDVLFRNMCCGIFHGIRIITQVLMTAEGVYQWFVD